MADNLSELDPISLGLAVQTPTGTGYCCLNFTFESRCFCSSSNGLWEKFDISVSRCRKRTARSEEWPRHFNVSVCTHYLSSNEYNPAQWPSIGRGNRRWKAALESLFARITVLVVGINQGAWNKGKQLMKVSDLPSTGTTHSIRLILAIFYWQANTFTQLCQNNTKRALLLWGLKQFLGSNMKGLRSKFDFKWTTTQTTVVSHRRRKRFSSSAGFLFRSELRDRRHNTGFWRKEHRVSTFPAKI